MRKKEFIINHFIYLCLVIYITWYGVFESSQLPLKIDTHIHVFRITNFIESFSRGNIFPSWHDSPFWGYPEDYNFFLPYLILAILNIFLPFVVSYKFSFILFFWMAGVTSAWCFNKILNNHKASFIGSLLYLGSASFINFGLGSGSLPRILAYSFFPVMLGTFIQWRRIPSKRTTLIFCLSFYLSYLVHPICALAGCISAVFIMSGTIKTETSFKEALKISWPWFLLGALPFSWQLGQLLLSRKYLSWDDLYQFYSNFRLQFGLKSFFGFWLDGIERGTQFYMGAFPISISIAGLVYLAVKKRFSQELCLPAVMALVGFLVILFGQDVIQRNTYRLDLIYNFGTSITCAYFLSQIRWKPVIYAITLGIVLEQTFTFREYAGQSYPNKDTVEKFKRDYTSGFKSARVRFDHIAPNLILNRKQINNLSTSHWTELLGVLEVTPYNLGSVTINASSRIYNSLYQFLGVPNFSEQDTYGIATLYSQFLIIEAPSRKASYQNVFDELVKDKDFNPYKMPFIFKEGHQFGILIKDHKSHLIADVTNDPDWKKKVYEFFKDNSPEEKFSPIGKIPKNHLLVIKEAYHPRRSLDLNEGEVTRQIVEPGLLGIWSSEDLDIKKLEIKNGLLTYEMILGLLTLISLGTIFFFLFTRTDSDLKQ